MRFTYRELERIPVWIGRASLHTREIFRPGLDRRPVERIRCGTHLQQHGIQVERDRAIKQVEQLALLRHGGKGAR